MLTGFHRTTSCCTSKMLNLPNTHTDTREKEILRSPSSRSRVCWKLRLWTSWNVRTKTAMAADVSSVKLRRTWMTQPHSAQEFDISSGSHLGETISSRGWPVWNNILIFPQQSAWSNFTQKYTSINCFGLFSSLVEQTINVTLQKHMFRPQYVNTGCHVLLSGPRRPRRGH